MWLGIGDSGYDEIPDELKECLTEYYRVDSMADYDAMVRAMGYFTFKYGKIDWLESNNEFWLEQDAALRTDFNITTGAQNDFIDRIKYKSKMKESYIAAGVPVARPPHGAMKTAWTMPAPLWLRSATRSL